MQGLASYQKIISTSLDNMNQGKKPKGLYSPIDYLLDLGGKRLRPVLVLMSCEAFGKSVSEAIPAAKAVELFHNFTLMHDDIMDKSFVRRGSQTVHEKWDTNTAILSGDAMLVQAYGCLNEYEPILYKKLTTLFSKTALEVCEGQQFDVDYESLSDVNIKSYLEMIRLKTAVLVGASMKMGALIGGANENEANKLYDFGEKLGIAFQLQDDYLDTFGNGTKFGKRIGGDIVENKKTILVHMLNQTGNKEQRNALQDWLSSKPKNESQKIAAVTKLFKSAKADISTLDYVQDYTNQAFAALDELLIKRESKKSFISFGNWLMNRTN